MANDELTPAQGIVIPDVVGELVGWRAWKVVGSPGFPRLYSKYGRNAAETNLWPTDRWFTAICPRGHKDGLPVESCTCGIYSARGREHLIGLGYNGYADEETVVIGRVGLAGKVIPGSQGFRAEKARVLELEVPFEKWAYAEALGHAYNVPVSIACTYH